jgi:hypothetical protein
MRRARRRRLAAAVGLALSGALLVGCGGDRDREPQPLPAPEYAEAVNAELAAFNSEFAALGEAAATAESREQYLDAVSDVHERVEATVQELGELRPPAAAETVHARLEQAFSDLARAYGAVVAAVEDGAEEEIRVAGMELERASRRFTREARAIDRAAKRAGIELEQLSGTASAGAS